MSLAGKIIAFVTKRSAQRIEAATKNAVQVQTDLLLGIVSLISYQAFSAPLREVPFRTS